MTIKITQLEEQLQTNLAHHHRNPSDMSIAGHALSLARAGIEELKRFPVQQRFKNKSDQELNFRILMPFFVSSTHYLSKVCRALEVKIAYGRDIFRDYLTQELSEVTKFLKYHLQYTQYSSIDAADLATPIITSVPNTAARKSTDSSAVQETDSPSVYHSPYLRVHLDYKEFLEFETSELSAAAVSKTGNLYAFVGSQADAMEQIQGWIAKEIITVNGKPANLRQVAEMWEVWFRMAIPNIYNKKRVNQRRKKGKTPFLSSMVYILQEETSITKNKRL